MVKQTTNIHFVRHGEVENPRSIRYGRLPGFHLNDTGRLTSQRVARTLSDRPITHIYTSPMERTQQTATQIGRVLSSLPITLDNRLLEVKTAQKFEGKSRTIPYEYPTVATADAETMDDVIQRLRHFCEEKCMEHAGEEIVAVSHGDPITLLYYWHIYGETTLDGLTQAEYGSITTFGFEGIKPYEVRYRGRGEMDTSVTSFFTHEHVIW
jgi:broad specificity phosphatase PhoE